MTVKQLAIGFWWLVCAAGRLVAAPPALFEPPEGCYLGAFVEHDQRVLGDYQRFEEIVGRKHACYLTYVGYGQPFPTAWALRVKAAGAAVHIGWEPNQGLHAVKDDEYLHTWAQAAKATGMPIFLRFASEMNGSWMPYSGDPRLFCEKWRIVSQVLKQEAPNVALVWCPFATPRRTIPRYYPGDEYVDWVGVNIYSVKYHNNDPSQPAQDEDPRELLRPIYDAYASRKPIMIAEYAATSWCRVVAGPTVAFALDKMTVLYRALVTQFPRVKCIQWFSWDTVAGGTADNNYSLTHDAVVTQRYHEIVSDPHFLSYVVTPGAMFRPRTPPRLTPFDLLSLPAGAEPSAQRWAAVETSPTGSPPQPAWVPPTGPPMRTAGRTASAGEVAAAELGPLRALQLASPARVDTPYARPLPKLDAAAALEVASLRVVERLPGPAPWTSPPVPGRGSFVLTGADDPAFLRPLRTTYGLKGLRPGEIVERATWLSAYAPDDWKVLYVAFRVDGRMSAATNQAPFRFQLEPDRLGPGTHTLSVQIHREGGRPVSSPPLEIEVRRPQ